VFAVASWARQIAAFEAAGDGDGGPHRLKVGNLAPVRDYGDVRDVARAYVALLEKGEAGAAYNVATGQGTTLRAIVDALVARARVGIEVTEEAARLRPNDVPYLVGSPARLTAATGWTPEYTLERTLSDLLDAARSAHAAPVEGGT
jgi:GDP-4-dehydro-6-deoxy-D-mannose reductase